VWIGASHGLVSTLRLTLWALLAPRERLPAASGKSGQRMTFTHLGEQWLDAWLERNAFVCWTEHPEPWLLEHELLATYSLPLNIQDNRHHHYCTTFSAIRQEAKRCARETPIAHEGNLQRQMTAIGVRREGAI